MIGRRCVCAQGQLGNPVLCDWQAKRSQSRSTAGRGPISENVSKEEHTPASNTETVVSTTEKRPGGGFKLKVCTVLGNKRMENDGSMRHTISVLPIRRPVVKNCFPNSSYPKGVGIERRDDNADY